MKCGGRRFYCSLVAVVALALGMVPLTAHAQTRIVHCPGQTISTALRLPSVRPLTINVIGACTENVVISRDGVTIQTMQGNPMASVTGADATKPTIFIDGVKNIVIDNLTISGGFNGVSATNGAVVTIRNGSVVQNAAQSGVTATLGASVTIDHAQLLNNGNQPTTNPAIGRNGFAVTDNSAGIITNSTVSGNKSNGIFVGRASSARIGKTLLNVPGGNVIQGNGGDGIFVLQAAQATIHANTIQNNTSNGISLEGAFGTITANQILNNGKDAGGGHIGDANGVLITNGGGARVGYDSGLDMGNANTISGNTLDGVLVGNTGNANLRGNTISNNGRRGLDIGRATGRLLGNNTISGNVAEGVLVGGGHLFQSLGDFSFTGSRDVISGNGTFGVDLFAGASADFRNVEISTNGRDGIGVFTGSALSLRTDDLATPGNRIIVKGNGTDATQGNRSGINVFNGSTADIRDVTISANAFRGIVVGTKSSLNLQGSIVGGATAADGNGTSGVAGNSDGIGVFTGSAANITSISDPTNGTRTTLISHNGGTGINAFDGAEVELRGGTTVSNNGGNGVNVGTKSSVFVQASTISNNTGDGINAFAGSIVNVGAAGSPSGLVPSVISNNGRRGIGAFLHATMTVNDSTIDHNTNTGITVDSGSALQLNTSTVSNSGPSNPVGPDNSASTANNFARGVSSFLGGVLNIIDSTITGNSGDGVAIDSNASLLLANKSSTPRMAITNNGGVGLQILTRSTANLNTNTGNAVVTISGNTGGAVGCFQQSFVTANLAPNISGNVTPNPFPPSGGICP